MQSQACLSYAEAPHYNTKLIGCTSEATQKYDFTSVMP